MNLLLMIALMAPPSASKMEGQILLDRWLQAQNGGDFAAYSELYAQKFLGIKRAGARTKRYQRKGWLKDRGKMFKGKLKVKAKDVEIRQGAGLVILSFIQTWQSRRFKDVGPKQLVLVREGENLRIAKEEMLHSKVSGEEGFDPRRLAFLKKGDQLMVLVQQGLKLPCAAPPKLISHGVSMRCPLNPRDLSTSQRRWIGKKLKLYGPGGEICEAQAGAPQLWMEFIPHFGQVQVWEGSEFTGAEKPSTPAEILEDAQSMASDEDYSLAFSLKLKGKCKGALWARDAALPKPKLLKKEKKLSWRAFRKLKAWKKIQRDYKRQDIRQGAPSNWDEYDAQRLGKRYTGGSKELLFFSSIAGSGCGGYFGELTGIWQKGPKDKLLWKGERGFLPEAVMEVDGFLLFLERGRLIGLDGTRFFEESMIPNSYDCPC